MKPLLNHRQDPGHAENRDDHGLVADFVDVHAEKSPVVRRIGDRRLVVPEIRACRFVAHGGGREQ